MFALFLLASVVFGQEDPLVTTDKGILRGSYGQNGADLVYEEYLGIPYAAPPLGDKRFTRPEEPDSWDGVRDAQMFGAHCIQTGSDSYPSNGLSNETSEDCLFLNVYVPGQNREGDNLAVAVWLHGGGYFFGSAAHYEGYELGLHGDIIVVTINYRLGPIGWLSTEDEVCPGNNGLWDTQLALQWVQTNIAGFGGDPDRVMVFGQSAGGALTSHVMVSPQTNNLLSRGIAISGSSSGYFGVALPGSVANSTQTLARIMGCRRLNSSQELLDCLREQDADELDFWGLVGIITFRQQLPNFMPVIDGDFIPVHPSELWNQGAANHLDFITGAVIQDAGNFVLTNLENEPNSTFNLASSVQRTETVVNYVSNHFPADWEDMKEVIYDQYPGLADNDTTTRTQALTNAGTDWWFDTWAHMEALQHASSLQSNTYLYEYAYSNTFLDPIKNINHKDWFIAGHSDDLFSVFGEPYRKIWLDGVWDTEFQESDSLVSDYVMSYYTNFANNGDPNVGLEVPVPWPTYSDDTKQYLQFSEQPSVLTETEEMLDNYRFWSEEFPEVALPEDSNILDMDEEDFETDHPLKENMESYNIKEKPNIGVNVLETLENTVAWFQKWAEINYEAEHYDHMMSLIDKAQQNRRERLENNI